MADDGGSSGLVRRAAGWLVSNVIDLWRLDQPLRKQASRMFRLAKALLANGLPKQERVAVLSRNCSECVEC